MNLKFKLGLFVFCALFLGLFAGLNAKAITGSINNTKKVYIYPWGGNLEHYAQWPKDFFEKVFKEFEVIPVNSLKNLNNFEYIVTEAVPASDQELPYLSHYPKDKVLLFVHETPIVCPRDHDQTYHDYYSKIFTWNDDFLDDKKYFKVTAPWGALWYQIPNLPTFENRKLSVFVGNIKDFLQHPLAQYHERTYLIDFFEEKPEGDFHFYGERVNGRTGYKNYKGIIPGSWHHEGLLPKIHTIKNYRFDFCYENVRGINGFFSERIFQSLSAGCIPIYWGIDNIEKYIPKNCFIAKTDFENYEELYAFMKNMSKKVYEEYRENIRQFLASDAAYRMSTPYYIKHAREILGLINKHEL